VVHGYIRPAAIFFTATGTLKLSGFGRRPGEWLPGGGDGGGVVDSGSGDGFGGDASWDCSEKSQGSEGSDAEEHPYPAPYSHLSESPAATPGYGPRQTPPEPASPPTPHSSGAWAAAAAAAAAFGYCAPETLVRGGGPGPGPAGPDERADVYSAGSVLWSMCTGALLADGRRPAGGAACAAGRCGWAGAVRPRRLGEVVRRMREAEAAGAAVGGGGAGGGGGGGVRGGGVRGRGMPRVVSRLGGRAGTRARVYIGGFPAKWCILAY
jgi:hypothetical protein